MVDFLQIEKIIKKYKTFAIIGHTSPDGDCLTSCSMMKSILMSIGKQSHFFVTEKNKIYDILEVCNDDPQDMLEEYDCIIVLDTSSINRIDNVDGVFERCKDVICIDHHNQVCFDTKNLFVDNTRSSVVEIIYELAKHMNVTITDKMASWVYSGLSQDTNCFMFNNVNQQSLKVFSEILEYNIDRDYINYHFFNKISNIDLKMVAYFEKHKKLMANNRVCYVVLPYKIVKKHHINSNYICKFARYLEDAKMGIVIKEKEKKHFSVSLRSMGTVSVSNVANKFGGGGHTNASGMSYQGKIRNLIELLDKECNTELDRKK